MFFFSLLIFAFADHGGAMNQWRFDQSDQGLVPSVFRRREQIGV